MVTGKGGVGKSAVSATLGRAIARRGRRTVVIEVDPRENLHQLLGTAPSGGEILEAGDGWRGGLFLQHLKPRAVVDRVIEERVKIGAVVRKVQASSVYQHFVEGCPGLEELAVLEHARRLLAERRFDTVILDAPATGHGVSLLRAPLVVSEAVGEGPFGSIAREIADLVADPARCGVVIVTQAEEMPVEEAQDLARMLGEHLDRRPDLLVVNGLYPPLPRGEGDGTRTRASAAGRVGRRRRAGRPARPLAPAAGDQPARAPAPGRDLAGRDGRPAAPADRPGPRAGRRPRRLLVGRSVPGARLGGPSAPPRRSATGRPGGAS